MEYENYNINDNLYQNDNIIILPKYKNINKYNMNNNKIINRRYRNYINITGCC